jgi:hypothetical protein
MRRVVAVTAIVLVLVGVTLGVLVGVVLNQPDGPPPLGDPADWGTGLDCGPGKTYTNGFFVLENSSGQTVTITGVRLIGGSGQVMTSPAYVVPSYPVFDGPLIGLQNWPPPPATAPQWRLRRLAIGATIAPHTRANLVFAQTRTSDHPTPPITQINYTAGGYSYTLHEPSRVLVAASESGCPA